MKSLSVMMCRFKRKQDSDYESGAMINEEQLIIDMSEKPVPRPIYSYINIPNTGAFIYSEAG